MKLYKYYFIGGNNPLGFTFLIKFLPRFPDLITSLPTLPVDSFGAIPKNRLIPFTAEGIPLLIPFVAFIPADFIPLIIFGISDLKPLPIDEKKLIIFNV